VSFISILFPDTGDWLRIADAKTQAGQAAWERATQAAIEFAQNPGTVAGAKLLELIGESSSLGDPTSEDWLEGLPPGQRAVALEQLAQVVSRWRDQTAATGGPVVQEVVAEDGTIVRVPASTKASAAVALRLAADQAGPQRGELLAKAAVATQEAEDLAKAAARSEAAWLARTQRRIDAALAKARARRRARGQQSPPAAVQGKATTAIGDDLPAPDMLFKTAGSGRRTAEADGLRARAAEYRALASVPGMPRADVATLERAADALEQQAGG
jgi:hypothetical protein